MDPSNHSNESYAEGWRDEPIQPKQKAALEFLKMPVPPTRGGASNLIKAVFEGLAGNAHQNMWDAAKYELHPELYPPAPKRAIPSASPPFFSGAMKAVLMLAVAFYAMDRYFERAVSPSPSNEPADEPTIVMHAAPPAAIITPDPPTPPEPKPLSDILALESTDGRKILAKVLALTKESVVIRREDGETFDLPLERLTDDSKRKIAYYRAAKRAGLVK